MTEASIGEYDEMETYDRYVRADDIYCDFLDAAIEIRFPELADRVKNELPMLAQTQAAADLWWQKLKAGDELKSNGTFDLTTMQIKSWGLADQDEQVIKNAIDEYRQSLILKS